ncbi:MAG TPA: hypothetical protein VFW11_09085 [Cyclobacteriaceae bacterium]|nr:hypothetical protein [Cyclobacteriaceae bacterium]
MKKTFFLTALCLVLVSLANAQDAAAPVSDDELQRYAVMMDSIDEMRIDLLAEISEMVKGTDKITVARYNDLSKISNDAAKLEEAKATPDEISFLKEIQTLKESGTAEINTTFRTMAKDYVGASTYNKVKKAITEDGEVKSKYETLLNKLKEDNGG